MSINRLTDFWWDINERWRRGEPLERIEIDFLLKAPGDIPEYAKPLVSALINGKVPLKRGQPGQLLPSTWKLLVEEVERVRQQIAAYRKHGKYDPTGKQWVVELERIPELASFSSTPLELALDVVADAFNISSEALEKHRKRRKRQTEMTR